MSTAPNRWSERRSARLGYLAALGWDAARLAGDAVVASSADEVRRRLSAWGLALRSTVAATPLNFDATRMAYFDAVARRRRLPTEALLRKLCEHVADSRAADAILDEAILDAALDGTAQSRPAAAAGAA